MTTTALLPETKTCRCGCGAEVKNRFRPGHDAKLKSRLVTATRTNRWWVREAALAELVELGWGHFADTETLATARVRSRATNGKFQLSLHLQQVQLDGSHVDEAGTHHGHAGCADAEGTTTHTAEVDTWNTCHSCVHVAEVSETVWTRRLHQLAAEAG